MEVDSLDLDRRAFQCCACVAFDVLIGHDKMDFLVRQEGFDDFAERRFKALFLWARRFLNTALTYCISVTYDGR